jgi:ABC-type transport system involved in cytochrome c biogenesis permease component
MQLKSKAPSRTHETKVEFEDSLWCWPKRALAGGRDRTFCFQVGLVLTRIGHGEAIEEDASRGRTKGGGQMLGSSALRMTFLPIVARELRVAARRRGTYWSRLGAALAALAVGCFIMLIPGLRSPQQLGMSLFVPLSVISFVYSLLAGIFTTADCLSEEKREGTLGLLFLTDLKGYDIVLGKLAATSVTAFYGMLAIFPVMAIPLLAGGVTGAEFWRVVLVSVNNLLFSLAVGMFCSAISKDERKAVVLAFVIVLFFTALLPLLAAWLVRWPRASPPIFFIPSPGFGCFVAFDAFYRTMPTAGFNSFYQSVLCVHLLAWSFLVTAWVIVPRAWQDRAESAGRTRLRERWLNWAHGSAATRQAVRRRLLEVNPYYWLAGRDRLKVLLVWALLGCGALLWLWGLWRYPSGWKDSVAYVWTALIAHTALKCWVALEACRRFGADRRSGALELVLSTPLKVSEIVRGQSLALFKQFAGPVLVVVFADFVFMLTEHNESEWILVWVAGMSVFVADMITLSWMAMWTGLTLRQANRAAGAALVKVLVLPWLVFGLLMLFVTLGAFSNPSALSGISEGHFVVLSWMGIALINDACFGWWARQRLLRDFRDVVAERVSKGRAPLN